jgi:acetyl esterase/lipase
MNHISRILVLSGLLVVAIPATAQVPQPNQLATLRKFDPSYRLPLEVDVLSDIVYANVDGRPVHLDLFSPNTGLGPFPAVLFIQGSGYNGNNKVHFWREAAHLASRGYVGITIEHRGVASDGVVWPAPLSDSQLALQWLFDNASEFRIDPSRVVVVGASSGAHLAALLGSTGVGQGVGGVSIRGVVAISGPLDLIYFGEHTVRSGDYGFVLDSAVFTPLLGASYDQRPELWRAASPISYLNVRNPPILIIHGAADATLPIEQAQQYYNVAREVGVAAEFVSIPGGGHEMTNTHAYNEVLLRVEAFVQRVIGPGQHCFAVSC